MKSDSNRTKSDGIGRNRTALFILYQILDCGGDSPVERAQHRSPKIKHFPRGRIRKVGTGKLDDLLHLRFELHGGLHHEPGNANKCD
jgi:hypothetical protein